MLKHACSGSQVDLRKQIFEECTLECSMSPAPGSLYLLPYLAHGQRLCYDAMVVPPLLFRV